MSEVIATNQTILVVGGSAKEAGLDGQVIRAKKREEIAVKVVKTK